MTMETNVGRMQTVGMVLLALAAGAAFWIGEGPGAALPVTGVLLAFAAFIAVFRGRSDTVSTMSGIGDERTRSLNERAMAATAGVLVLALPAAWLVTVAVGEPNTTLALVCAGFALVWAVSTAVLSRRG